MSTDLWTPAKVAEYLEISPSSVRNLVSKAVLVPEQESSRNRVYSREQVERVKRAQDAGKAATEEALSKGRSDEIAREIGQMVERREIHKASRVNRDAITKRARGRLQAMEDRLNQIEEERVLVAAELDAIDSERDYLAEAIERLLQRLHELEQDA